MNFIVDPMLSVSFRKSSVLFGAVATSLFLLGGCVVAPVYYEPGVLKNSSAAQAVLLLGENGAVAVRSLDGKELANPLTTWNGYSGVRELRLRPGVHTLVGMAWSNGLTVDFEFNETFEAGANYRISTHQEGYTLQAVFQRTNSGENE